MQEQYNIFNKKSKNFVSKISEIKRHRKHMANQKDKTLYSYQSIKNISDDVIFYRQNYNKVISKVLRTLNLSVGKDWEEVISSIMEIKSCKKIDYQILNKIIFDFVIFNPEFVNEKPFVLKNGNYYPIIDTGNTFYVENNILKKPKSDSSIPCKLMGNNENEWFLFKKDDKSWYKVVLKDADKTYNVKDWTLEYLDYSMLTNKRMIVSSLSKKEKRKLMKRLNIGYGSLNKERAFLSRYKMEVIGVYCYHCKAFTYSRSRHDMTSCICENKSNRICIDGGQFDYVKINCSSNSKYKVIRVDLNKVCNIEITEKEMLNDWNQNENKLGLIKDFPINRAILNDLGGVLIEDLKHLKWYIGICRNSKVARWDEKEKVFHFKI